MNTTPLSNIEICRKQQRVILCVAHTLMAHLFLHTQIIPPASIISCWAGGDVRHSNRQTQKRRKRRKSQIKIVRRCDGSLPPPVSVLAIQHIETSMLGIFVRFPCTTSHRKKQVNGKKSSYTHTHKSPIFPFIRVWWKFDRRNVLCGRKKKVSGDVDDGPHIKRT